MAQIDLGPVIGPQGPKGDPGEIGPQGPQGPQGPAGKFDMDAGLTFSKASARANINSGESLKTILGKIKKYFTDLKPHAFKAPANNFTTTDATTAAAAPTVKQLKEDYDALNSALTTIRTLSPWTLIEYPDHMVEMWRYATISATDKTNTFALPTPMYDNQFGIKAFPVFNGHLCKSLWAGTPVGADGRTETTVQISMDSTDSEHDVGIMIFITGYRAP